MEKDRDRPEAAVEHLVAERDFRIAIPTGRLKVMFL
jgi:hypothetical protein